MPNKNGFKKITAQFEAKCSRCHEMILPRTKIEWRKVDGISEARHLDCAEAFANLQEIPTLMQPDRLSTLLPGTYRLSAGEEERVVQILLPEQIGEEANADEQYAHA